MAVTKKDVRAALDPEEPDYQKASTLGPEALPHLDALVSSGDSMLASKATYLASLIKDPRSAEIVAKAAQNDNPAVRVAAACAASNLAAAGASSVLELLSADTDAGVRKVARAAAPGALGSQPPEKTEVPTTQQESPGGTGAPALKPLVTGLMPGETAEDMRGATRSTMPGELPGAMPGEKPDMPRR
jgi:hypothetical protein